MFSSFFFISATWLLIATLGNSQQLTDDLDQLESSIRLSKDGEPCSFNLISNGVFQEGFKCDSGLICVITTTRSDSKSGICDRVGSNIGSCKSTCKNRRHSRNKLCIGEDNLTFRCSTLFPIGPTPPPCDSECKSACRNSGPGKPLVTCSLCLAAERSKRSGCSIMWSSHFCKSLMCKISLSLLVGVVTVRRCTRVHVDGVF